MLGGYHAASWKQIPTPGVVQSAIMNLWVSVATVSSVLGTGSVLEYSWSNLTRKDVLKKLIFTVLERSLSMTM